MAVITLGGNFERPRGSIRAIHDALKYPDNSLLFLPDLREIADGDHGCERQSRNRRVMERACLPVCRQVTDIHDRNPK